MIWAVPSTAADNELEILQLTLDRAILQNSNANLQYQLRMGDDPVVRAAKDHLNLVVKQIADKGYVVKQGKNGEWTVEKAPDKTTTPAVVPPTPPQSAVPQTPTPKK